jgi:hypothetical protein
MLQFEIAGARVRVCCWGVSSSETSLGFNRDQQAWFSTKLAR